MKIFPADTAFSLCIRTRDNWTCQRCWTVYLPPTQALHCMHWHSRGKWSTRFHPANAAAGCYGCHRYLDTHPVEKDAFFRALLGDVMADEITRLAKAPGYGIKKELRQIAKHYREQLKALEAARMNGHRHVLVGYV